MGKLRRNSLGAATALAVAAGAGSTAGLDSTGAGLAGGTSGSMAGRGGAAVAVVEECVDGARPTGARATGLGAGVTGLRAGGFAAVVGALVGLHPWWELALLAPLALLVLGFPDRRRARAELEGWLGRRAREGGSD